MVNNPQNMEGNVERTDIMGIRPPAPDEVVGEFLYRNNQIAAIEDGPFAPGKKVNYFEDNGGGDEGEGTLAFGGKWKVTGYKLGEEKDDSDTIMTLSTPNRNDVQISLKELREMNTLAIRR